MGVVLEGCGTGVGGLQERDGRGWGADEGGYGEYGMGASVCVRDYSRVMWCKGRLCVYCFGGVCCTAGEILETGTIKVCGIRKSCRNCGIPMLFCCCPTVVVR